MFRGVTNVILILGILLCPLYCGEMGGTLSDTSSCRSSEAPCGCGCERSTGGEQNGPAPCHDGCPHDCVCKGLLMGQGKLFFTCVDFRLSACDELCVAVPAPLGRSSEIVGAHSSTHPELASGAAIRLAFASLLI
jgi:hypothetical protein